MPKTNDDFKVCGCGRRYATRAAWSTLPDAKVYRAEDGSLVEQRRCECGSHIVAMLIATITYAELRKAYREIDSWSRAFCRDFTVPELLQLVRVYWDAEAGAGALLPEVWTQSQVGDALSAGLPPPGVVDGDC